MTEYEIQTLAIAKLQFWTYVGADVIAALALIAAVCGAYIAFKSVRASQWNTLLLFEQDMAARRGKFQELGQKLHDSAASTEMLNRMYEEAKESYFNSLDRLASSIIKGHFPDSEMKLDYREAIAGVVRAFPNDFATGTHYRKVVKLYEKWQDQP